jgi:hypothetical protein
LDTGQFILILIALVAANLPFLSERIFFVVRPREGKKHLGWRVVELVALYLLVGGAAYLLENRLGTPHEQHWEFYAITACLFLVFAYPGFVARYLWNARGR